MSNVIAVFGSARIKPSDALYQACYDAGYALAQAGYSVMTGGYGGVMAAISHGAADGGGAVLGITVANLEAIGESQVNQWVTDEIHYQTLSERIDHLIQHADGYLVMPGGVGTAQELIEVWQRIRLGELSKKPVMLYGDFWHPMINQMLQSHFISEKDRHLVSDTAHPADIVTMLNNWFTKEQD